MIWETRHHTFDFTHRGAVMGILNVTPDSFSDGGCWVDVEAAIAHAEEMLAEGAEILDVGGESTRPGATPVTEGEEMRRVIPVIERLVGLPGKFAISVDTMKPSVAREACAAGASIINDVGGLRDPAMLDAAAETGAGVVAMHMLGTPQTMQAAPRYENVSSSVREFFCQTIDRAVRSGVPAAKLVLDPGIGFGKTVEHNLELLRRLPGIIVGLSRPVLLGVSRKSFIGKVLGSSRMEDRSWPTVALTSFGREKGARIFRVHEVKANVEALRMTEAILG